MRMSFTCIDTSTDFALTVSACLQVEYAKLEVSRALCAQLHLLGFMQRSAQAELGFCIVWHAVGGQLQCPPPSLLPPRKVLLLLLFSPF